MKPSNAALLVMDIQNTTMGLFQDPERNALISALRASVDGARAAGIPVIYVIVAFRKGFPEVSSENKSFGALKSGAMPGLDGEVSVHDSVRPEPGEVVITKKRVSAFAGSDLEVVLRGGNIRHLVLTGVATSGVVLSTLREAADKDFKLTVLSDACADRDPEVHQVLMGKVFPRQADVLTVSGWVQSLV